MSHLSAWRIRLSWVAILLFLLVVAPCSAQFTDPKPSALRKSLVQLLNDDKIDEAIGIVKERSAEPKPSSDVPEATFMVARFLYRRDKYAESLDLLKNITEKFPDSAIASLAWCGTGQVYGKLGDDAKMIAALE